jgi:hypothetical protein
MQQSVTTLPAVTVPLPTLVEGAHEPLAVGSVVSMMSYASIAGRLTPEQVSGTGMLVGATRQVGSDVSAAPPPVHFACGVPHVHALQARVSTKVVPMVTFVV